MADTYRTGHKLGTTIYRVTEGFTDQPCAWVPSDAELAGRIVALLNGEAESRAQVAALIAERDAAEAELAAAKQDAEGLEHACEVINQIAGDDFCEDLEMRAADGSMADTDIGIAQKKLSAVYRAAHSATKRSCFSAHEDWREEVVKAIDAARAPEGTEGIGHDETAA